MSLFNVTACLLANLIPWLSGFLFLRLFFGAQLPTSCHLAHGYLLGMLMMTLAIRLCDAAGLPFAFWPLAGCLLLISIGELALIRRARAAASTPMVTIVEAETVVRWKSWHVLLTGSVLGLIALRVLLAAHEITLLPLFPWDAWDSWAPLTIQYFASGDLSAEFGTKAGGHGKTVGIIHLWSMLAGNTSSHPLTHLPWLFAWLAIALAIHGHILKRTANSLAAMLGAYLLLSIPYLYIHAVLAGYADIWLALAFTLGVLTVSVYQQQRQARFVALALLYAFVCASIKQAGILLGASLLLLLALALVQNSRLAGYRYLFAGLTGLLLGSFVLYKNLPLELDLPFVGNVLLNSSELIVADTITYPLAYRSILRPLLESLFLFAQVHLLTPMVCATIVLLVLCRQWRLFTETSFWAFLAGGVLLWLYFSVADFRGATEHTGLTRTLMVLMPSAVFWCVIALAHLAAYPAFHRDK